jgi:aspartyl-tRNA(Asn)/glutamyl-tRNA(Gln) amidotransferase subunit A
MYQYQSIEQLHKDLKNGSITCTQLVQQYIQKIKEHQNLNIYLEVFEK